jgi:hypothetical protein
MFGCGSAREGNSEIGGNDADEENDVIDYDDFQPNTYMEEKEDEFDDEDWEDDGDDYEEDEY